MRQGDKTHTHQVCNVAGGLGCFAHLLGGAPLCTVLALAAEPAVCSESTDPCPSTTCCCWRRLLLLLLVESSPRREERLELPSREPDGAEFADLGAGLPCLRVVNIYSN